MKDVRPILSASPNGSTGSLSVKLAVDVIRSAGVFDERFYLERYVVGDPLLKFVDPISHYLVIGHLKGFNPSSSFDAADYRARYMRGKDRALNPLLHLAGRLVETGAAKGLDESCKASPRCRSKPSKEPDFSKLARRTISQGQPVIDVIMPVYSGYTETLQAIYAVLSSRNKTPFQLVIAEDGSPDALLVEKLEALANAGMISLLRNERNLGFVRTINKALALHGRRDAILLNSDTMVFGDWVDRLSVHATGDVATVTPFSNNASLCSYPRIFEENDIPRAVTARSLDRMTSKLNRGQSVEVPTGVGFCMYVTRAALRKVGRFDAKTFGRGYGEENDFCLRAMKAGFRNLHALDVFVFHKGAVSFGAHGALAKARQYKKLLEKHPGYRAQVRKFAVEDPALPARQRLDVARLLGRTELPVVLYVAGQSDKSLKTIEQRRKRSGRKEIPLLVRPDPGGRSVCVAAAHGDVSTPNLKGIPLEEQDTLFGELLRVPNGLRVEVHGTDGYAAGVIRQLQHICKGAGVTCRTHISGRRN